MPGPVRCPGDPLDPQKVAALTSSTTFTNMGIVLPTGGGPAGDVSGNGVAQSPAPIGLGATWSSSMAAQYGNELGQEARARNKSLIAAPVIDLMRTWHQGRQAEGFGEDPFLTGSLAAAEIPAIQQNHVEDMAKHVGAYTQETGRAGDAPTASGPNAPASFPNNELMSLKTLNELYLAPFGAASLAGASEIMCAFPEVNGVFGCRTPTSSTSCAPRTTSRARSPPISRTPSTASPPRSTPAVISAARRSTARPCSRPSTPARFRSRRSTG